MSNTNSGAKPKERRWLKPSKRAEGYAEERRENQHKRGPKEGQELDDYNKGLRSGYLLCQSDHAGAFIYKKTIDETGDKKKAQAASKTIGKHRGNK